MTMNVSSNQIISDTPMHIYFLPVTTFNQLDDYPNAI